MPEEREPEFEELEQALVALRQEIRSRFPAPREPGAPVEPIDWQALLTELRRRLGSFGMSERSGEVDEFGMDEVVLGRARPLLELLYDRYWRVDLAGLEKLPERGPCLLVANRSGMLPYDGLMLAHAIERFHPSGERPRFLVADWLVTLPFVQPYLARLGGVRACRENAERLLASGRYVIAFPEGAKGAAKVFRERYRLKRFGRGGVVRVALENGVPLVPVGIVGAEEAHPVLFKWHLPARSVGGAGERRAPGTRRHRRGRGGAPGALQVAPAGPKRRPPVPADHPDLPAAGSAGLPAAPHPVGDPDR
jgi:1-acyl-sn-glycerol-3-phosphate acyltransferase